MEKSYILGIMGAFVVIILVGSFMVPIIDNAFEPETITTQVEKEGHMPIILDYNATVSGDRPTVTITVVDGNLSIASSKGTQTITPAQLSNEMLIYSYGSQDKVITVSYQTSQSKFYVNYLDLMNDDNDTSLGSGSTLNVTITRSGTTTTIAGSTTKTITNVSKEVCPDAKGQYSVWHSSPPDENYVQNPYSIYYVDDLYETETVTIDKPGASIAAVIPVVILAALLVAVVAWVKFRDY